MSSVVKPKRSSEVERTGLARTPEQSFRYAPVPYIRRYVSHLLIVLNLAIFAILWDLSDVLRW